MMGKRNGENMDIGLNRRKEPFRNSQELLTAQTLFIREKESGTRLSLVANHAISAGNYLQTFL
jgi:hypothetical protein